VNSDLFLSSCSHLRSRLVRIAPSFDPVQELFYFRLDPNDEEKALLEWNLFLTGRHTLFEGIHPQKKQIIKQFLIYFHSQILSTPFEIEVGFEYKEKERVSLNNSDSLGKPIFLSKWVDRELLLQWGSIVL
jgi:hypothetical protein